MTSLQPDLESVIELVPESEIRRLVGEPFLSITDGYVFFNSPVGIQSVSLLAFSFKPAVASAIVQYKLFLAETDSKLKKCLDIIDRA